MVEVATGEQMVDPFAIPDEISGVSDWIKSTKVDQIGSYWINLGLLQWEKSKF